ncbi:MAG: right-handed parallel beta-helix repeat-containing protein [Bacteroidales bacterium]|nr:right-handed parallel beta-helix repeat-containing protein [Bacteroidales bacterium]
MTLRINKLIGVVFIVCGLTMSHAAIIEVPGDYPTIQAGIDAALTGDTVLIADGEYSGNGNVNISFQGKAITVTSENGPSGCIINCANADRGFIFNSDEMSNSMLNGIKIRNGRAALGGGVLIENASPVIQACEVIQCSATFSGGGIYSDGGSPDIIDTVISNNRVTNDDSSSGAGMYAANGAPQFMGCLISQNSTLGDNYGTGGGIHLQNCTQAGFTDCEITNNHTNGSLVDGGGGIFVKGTATFTNCLISNNTCVLQGGGLWCFFAGVQLLSTTIANNDSDMDIGDGIDISNSTLTILNSIVKRNDYEDITSYESSISATYSNLPDNIPGTGNISENPGFVSGPDGAYYLKQIYAGQQEDSLCVNAGSALSSQVCYDLNGSVVCMDQLTTRTDHGMDIDTVDMGYHYGEAVEIPTPTPEPTTAATQTPTPTADIPGTQTPLPNTPTSTPPTDLTFNLIMPQTFYKEGDVFCLDIKMNAPYARNLDLYVILDVFGIYYFAPMWSTELDNETISIESGQSSMEIIGDFPWPQVSETVTGLRFWGALTEVGNFDLAADIDMEEFGYGL